MPDFLVSAATGALSPVLQKLTAFLGDEYKRFKGVRGEVESLIRELEAMHAFLLKKSEEEKPDVQDKAWMKEVRELSYDIEDSLDEFRVRIDDESTKPDGFIDKCKNLVAKTKTRHRIAKAIQDLKAQVREVSERKERYRNISESVMNTSNGVVDRRALAMFVDASRLEGIDKPKQEVISFLRKEDRGISSQQPKMVSIVGIGGIGKTTLAKQVYEELKGQFQCRSFLSVSRNPDMFMILRTILCQVNGQHYCDTEEGSIQPLIMKINEFLQAKRFLIVVDDIWNEKTWDPIKCALSNNSCGSVIITTTRIHKVAEACCSSYSDSRVYKPKPLKEHDSKRLFQNRIFGPGNECPENLKEVSDKILKKCGGLPLAIITIAGLLASKARHGGLERGATAVEEMMGILSVSYFDLPYHLKACLLYLSVFPEDYCIEKERLILLWVAEGFIPAKSKCSLYESGEESFNELINRSLILPEGPGYDTGKVYSCRVHDTILDFIVRRSTEDNFVTVVDGGGDGIKVGGDGIKVRRLSLQGETAAGDAALDSNKKYANVRSIISFGSPCSLLGFRSLRVLDFENCKRLENRHLAHIGQLFQLRYLSLSRTSITEIPEQIGELQYLETLEILMNSKMPKIPTAIVRLKRLVNLLMGPVRLSCLPDGIKNMQALEKLTLLVILEKKTAANCIEEIGELNKMRDLCIVLYLEGSYNYKASYLEFTKKTVSSIQRLNKLQTLDVRVQPFLLTSKKKCSQVIDCSGDDNMFEVPWCCASLRKLEFTISPIPGVPRWMKSLVNIEELDLRMRKLDQESLYVFGSLAVLVYAKLHIAAKVEDRPSADKQRLTVSPMCGYRSLRYLKIWASENPCHPMLMFEAGSMPKLEHLQICFDADTTIFVANGRLDFGLKHLSQLTGFICDTVGRKLNILRVEAAIEKELNNHPNHPHFLKGERSNREWLRPRRRSLLTVHTAQPKPPSIADDVVISSSADKTSSSDSASHDNADPQLSTAVLPLPTDLYCTIDHHGVLGTRRGRQQQGRHSKTRHTIARRALPSSTTISGRGGLVQGTAHSHSVKGSSDAKGGGPTQQQALVPPFFTFSAGSSSVVAEQQAPVAQSPALSSWDLNVFSGAFSSLSLHNDDLDSTATAVEGASHTGAPTAHGLGPGLIADPQQTSTACFTFNAGSSNPEKQALASYEPLKFSHNGAAETAVETTYDAGSSNQEGSRREE